MWVDARLLFLFSLFHLSDHRGRDPLALQPHCRSTKSGPRRKGAGLILTDAAINQLERDVCLKVPSVERAFFFDDDSFDIRKKQNEAI